MTSGPSAVDPTVWRVVGDPLVPGAGAGPLAGLRVAVKDLFAVAGHRVGAGNPAWLAAAGPEREHAAAVRDLLDAGADVAGIARTDEFAYSIAGANEHYGTPPNAARPGALPGGSSSGPASAVASGQADVGLATDTAGSVRVPASYQGLWGLRTTHGLVSRDGLLALAPSFDTVGWLTRDGATLQRVADRCVPGAREEAGPPRLLVAAEALAAAEPRTQEAFTTWLADVADRAGEVREVFLGDLTVGLEAFRAVQAAEAWRVHGPWLTAHPGAVRGAVAGRFAAAARVTPAEEERARRELARWRAGLRAVAGEGVLVLPAVPGPAPARGTDGAELEAVRRSTLLMTTPAAIAGLPALSVPALTVAVPGEEPGGTGPVGVSLVGPPGGDARLVRVARRLCGDG